MGKILHILLVFLFSFTIISCGTDDGGSSASTDNSSTTSTSTTTTTDTTAPTVSSVSSSSSNARYFAYDNISITVTFSETVVVDNSSGNPQLLLETGTTDRYATYSGGSNSSTLTFIYTVISEDSSSDLGYKSTSSLSLNSGTIKDSSSNDATLTLPSPGASGSLSSNRDLIIGGWNQQAYIKAVNNDTQDFFGSGCASYDNDTLAVGAQNEDSNQTSITNGTSASSNNDNTSSGAIYIYRRSGDYWTQEAYIKASNNDSGDTFGTCSLDGDTLAVGAPNEDSNQTSITNGTSASSDNSNANSGAVYIYKRTGTSWAQEAYIKASNNGAGDTFGFRVSLDGDTLAVGARYEDSNQTSITNGTSASSDNSNANSGAVYIYKRTGTSWAQEAYIKASNNGAGDDFGDGVSLDGDRLAVGASNEDSNQTTITNGTSASSNNSNTNSGVVYIYKRTGTNWAQEAYIKGNCSTNGSFGWALSLDNDSLAVGAPLDNSDGTGITNGTGSICDTSLGSAGTVFVYRLTGTNWAQEAYIKPLDMDFADYFGNYLSIDGDKLAVVQLFDASSMIGITNGIPDSIDDDYTGSGAVYVYKRSGTTWEHEAFIKASNNHAHAYFGSSIDISGSTLVVGKQNDNSSQSTISNDNTSSYDNSSYQSGAVFVYLR